MSASERPPRRLTTPPGTTIGEQWADYVEGILRPAGAGAVQIEECKRAFYAGALTAFHILSGIGRDVPDDEAGLDQGAARIESAIRECEDFFSNLARRA